MPFKPGAEWNGNSDGRPVGSGTAGISITTELKKKLMECPEGENKRTYLQLIILKILAKALKDGDTQILKSVWAYIDGLPKQDVKLDAELILNVVKYEGNNDTT